jgi:transcriptional regulator with XRE-family HTH domain
MIHKKLVAKRIKTLRKQHNLTQVEVADKAGISQGTYSVIERTGTIGSVEMLYGLAKAYRMKECEFLIKVWGCV